MNTQKTIGYLLIAGAVGVFVPYLLLTIIFDYPDILRQSPGIVLTKFNNGGSLLIFAWLAFALLGLPLLAAYILLGRLLQQNPWAKIATVLGIVSAIVQIVGLLRWVFVVPVLANAYVNTADATTHKSIELVFMAVHQFGGVLLGEFIGQLFTVIYTIIIASILCKEGLIPKWTAIFGYVASGIYFLAQAELMATVIPGFLVWDLAGLIGSTLWLVWLVIVGILLIKNKNTVVTGY